MKEPTRITKPKKKERTKNVVLQGGKGSGGFLDQIIDYKKEVGS